MYANERPMGFGRKGWNRGNRLVIAAISLLFLLATAGAVIFYYKYQQLKTTPAAAANSEAAALTAQVGRLLALPKGERPTIATVTDPKKLKDQEFFSGTAKGDKLLIYSTAKKAIIFRPSDNQIINVGPIAINAETEGATSTKQ